MSKPPPKGAASATKQAQLPVEPSAGKAYQTRSHAPAAATQSPMQSASVAQDLSEETCNPSPLCRIVESLTHIIDGNKINATVKRNLESIIQFALKAEKEEALSQMGNAGTAKVREICDAIKADIVHLHNSLYNHLKTHTVQLEDVLNTTSAILTGNDKLKEAAETAKTDINEVISKVSKVTVTADKIVSDSKTYRDALLAKPNQTNRMGVDPKILSDLERKAKQILVGVHGSDGDALLSKSLTEIIGKANDALTPIEDSAKPKEVKVVAALKTRGKTLLLTMNSRSAADWVRETDIEMKFTDAFSISSHVRQRTYNLILPGIPTTFNPDNAAHLREVEEINSLRANTIFKARWIKPIGRRRPDQTHAYAIFSLFSVNATNELIRDGIIVCGAKVRPKKQKHEPMQCMRCRRWGHLVTECKADSDVCGRCGDNHRTDACTSKDKLYCVNCEDSSHPSWSRECPEFNRKCHISDERNPVNTMPFYPTEHDWTLITRPAKIPLEDRFPKQYVVSNAPHPEHRQRDATRRMPQGTQERTGAPKGKGKQTNPNFTPLGHRKGEGEPPVGSILWMAERDNSVLDYDNTDESNPLAPPGWP